MRHSATMDHDCHRNPTHHSTDPPGRWHCGRRGPGHLAGGVRRRRPHGRAEERGVRQAEIPAQRVDPPPGRV